MTQRPEFHAAAEDDDEGNTPFGLLVFALGAFALAGLAMWGGVWESQIENGGGGRRQGFRDLLDNIGQVPVAAGIGVIGLLALVFAVLGFVRDGKEG